MIQVGFVMEFAGDGWLGGSSYYRNLFSAIRDFPARKVNPVLITSSRSLPFLKTQFPNEEIMRMPLLDAPSLVGTARRVMRALAGRDVLMERALASRSISILSHSGYYGRSSPIASIAWIPDFQELTFPGFFSRRELASRRRNAIRSGRHATTVLLSSESSRADFKKSGVKGANISVLPFVATVPPEKDLLPREQLIGKFGLADKYFHLPNQFWIHKNHSVVLRALGVLREQGKTVQVIATGNTNDPRQPAHFSALMESAGKLRIGDLFKPLGVVPYQDLMSLMRHAVAVINPSKFEGWSTTVEEAKSMGKTILLSDIPVHREQAPERSVFFTMDDTKLLASKMSEVYDRWDADADSRFVSQAAANLSARRELFARRYQEIVLATLDRKAIHAKWAEPSRLNATSPD